MTRKTQGTPGHDPNTAPRADSSDDQGIQGDEPVFRIPGLTAGMRIFCQEYATTRNATESYFRAHPGCTRETAGTEGWKYLQNPAIQSEIQRLLDESAAVTGITRDRVLLKLWQIATADPRKLTELRKGACRHCWGMYHQYQYTDAEYEKAESDWIHKEAKRKKAEKDDFEPQPFPRKGGTGYHPDRQPNPECPECFGEGTTRVVLHDTRTLAPEEAALFAGVKVSEKGAIEVKTHNPVEALIRVGTHLRMWDDKAVQASTGNPLAELLEAIQKSNASALPLVADDPDLRDRPAPVDVQDVEPKPAKKAPAWRPA